jgi:predicted nucleotidyltransferase component of viral defense system
VRLIPSIAQEPAFALKGGTAINLFIRDMPRLSVDIDLTYLPVKDRRSSLAEIDAALQRIAGRIRRLVPRARVNPARLKTEPFINKPQVQLDTSQVKIEVTPVLRGCVYEPAVRRVSPRVEDEFGLAEMRILSLADLYAGKLVAALYRQHPRDLFDVRELLANEGITDEMRTAFIAYLASADRPMAEIVRPTERDISQEFQRGFGGMTEIPVDLPELIAARRQLIDTITGGMPDAHKRFLVSFKHGAPEWSLLDASGIDRLPAVQWRLENLRKVPDTKRTELVARLKEALGIA